MPRPLTYPKRLQTYVSQEAADGLAGRRLPNETEAEQLRRALTEWLSMCEPLASRATRVGREG